MRSYSKISPKLWVDPKLKFLNLSNEGKVLYLYLLSGPHTNMLGCFRLPISYIMTDLNWIKSMVLETLYELFESGLIMVSEQFGDGSETIFDRIFVPGLLKMEQIQNPNQAKKMEVLFDDIPNDTRLSAMVADELLHSPHLSEQFRNRLETVSEQFRNSFERVSTNHFKPFLQGAGNQEQEQEQKHEQEQENNILIKWDEIDPPTNDLKSQKVDHCSTFKTFWSIYPRKVGKAKSFEIWKRKKLYQFLPAILEDLSQRHDWHSHNAFTPHPTTYLNGRRWEDEEKCSPIKQPTQTKSLADQLIEEELAKQAKEKANETR